MLNWHSNGYYSLQIHIVTVAEHFACRKDGKKKTKSIWNLFVRVSSVVNWHTYVRMRLTRFRCVWMQLAACSSWYAIIIECNEGFSSWLWWWWWLNSDNNSNRNKSNNVITSFGFTSTLSKFRRSSKTLLMVYNRLKWITKSHVT